MTAIANKYVARAVDGYGKTLHRVLIWRRGRRPTVEFARQCLRLFVRKKFDVAIEPATARDLS